MDLHQPPTDPNQAILERLSAIESQLTALAAIGVKVAVGSGAPTHAAVDGTFFVRSDSTAIYVRVNGAWKSVAVA